VKEDTEIKVNMVLEYLYQYEI